MILLKSHLIINESMSGMLSTISNVLTTAVKSQFQTYLAIESCDDFLTFISKTKAATSNRSFVFFIVILIMCNIRMKKSFVRTITLHFVCESVTANTSNMYLGMQSNNQKTSWFKQDGIEGAVSPLLRLQQRWNWGNWKSTVHCTNKSKSEIRGKIGLS